MTSPVPPIPASRSGHRFQNWAETISCRPETYSQPRTIDEIADIVKTAARAGKKVRTVGAGHSWAPLVLTNDVLVNLDRMGSLISVDRESKRVTVQAGIRLKNLIRELRRNGLGMANIGSVTEQSIAGAVATGTHGTGLAFGNLSTQVVGMKVVSGTGDVVQIDAGDPLLAARLSLGAVGIVAEVTLQCVKDYDLEYSAYWCDFDEIVDQLDTLNRENDRVRLWWLVWELGCRRNVIVTTMNEPGKPPGLLGRFEKIASGTKSPLSMETKELLARQPRRPDSQLVPFHHYTDAYDRVLTVPLLRVLHRECEYAVPIEKTAEALRACRTLFDEGDVTLPMPLEVRFVRSDESLLSPAYGRDVCYVGVSATDNATEVFARFEPLVRGLEGRPHWAKFFTLSASQTRDLYPESYDRFCEVRRTLDPKGVFANDQMQQLFG
jgi:FAD/FMN-containing dehydrogenase